MSYAIKRSKFRGDPGLFSTLGGLAAKGIGFAQQMGVLPGGGPGGGPMIQPPRIGMDINPPMFGMPGTGLTATLPGGLELGMGIGEIPEAVGLLTPGPNGAGQGNVAPGGWHWNKAGYFLKSGQFVPKGTKLVKNRRRNPLNPRALDRAMWRITSAKGAASKLGRITIRKACAHK